MLSASELKEFKWDVYDYIKYGQENDLSGQWIEQLENASAKFHISKYDALKIQTQQSIESLFAKQSDVTAEAMKGIYQSGYYRTAFEIQKDLGIGWDISEIEQDKLEKVIAEPWAVDGENFSERIWSNKQKLISDVNKELTRNIIMGADSQKAFKAIAGKLNVSKSSADRLVMTEGAYFGAAAQRDCFEELGVEEYEIIATLDSHTSEICQSMNGERFAVKEFRAGDTAPPFHPWCRSTVCPCFDDDFGKKAGDGERYRIPEDLNYQDWKKAFVDGGDKSAFAGVDKSGNGGIIEEKKDEWDNGLPPRGQLPHIDEDALYSYVANELKIDENKAITFTDSVIAFTDDYYTDIRKFQRGDYVADEHYIKFLSDNIEDYIKKAPRWNGGETFRGCTVSDDELSLYKKGYFKDMGGTSSWSNVEDVSKDFAEDNVTIERPNKIIFHCDTQSKGTGIKHISVFENEYEVICSKESCYEIIKMETDYNNFIHIHLKEV